MSQGELQTLQSWQVQRFISNQGKIKFKTRKIKKQTEN